MTKRPDGSPHPLGARVTDGGVNFSVFSRSAERVELLLYDHVDDASPSRVLALDARRNRTYHYRHLFVPGVRPGQIYAWRAHGALDPARGVRFDADKVLLDPYGRAVAVPSDYRRLAACARGPNDAFAFKSVVTDVGAYDWEGDEPLRRPFAQTVIYEMHVRGFTARANSGVAPGRRGTYAGLVEKIPYLLDLGITAVELLPVFQFDWQDAPPALSNYWGYAPVSFFAPHAGYSSRRDPLGVLDEFRDMVKALHRAGIEVILDVVYNHTTEGDERGPTLSLRGLENPVYYMLEDGGRYANYSGTGNTLNANHAIVRRLILDSLRYWVEVMHVDGFRFDLAAILSRDENGRPLANPPVLWTIESDPILAGTKLIAEAWDAGGLYQVGNFVGDSWKEWNGQFRDDVRAFVRGDPGIVPRLADRLMGSPDLYADNPREPAQSINFVTSHDGFTLEDLVSYERKRNEANLEGNRDGTDHNLSWNCGVEGPTDDPAVLALRTRQIKNLLAITILSLGTPMLLMGDEVRRTQFGNNNAYCQDNEISWFDWSALEHHAEIRRFVRGLIRLRGMRESVHTDHHLTLAEVISRARLQLHGVRFAEPDVSHASRSLAVTASSLSGDLLMHFALNAYWEPLEFELPVLENHANGGWRRLIDSSRPSPHDLVDLAAAERVAGTTHRVEPHAVVMLVAIVRPNHATP
jgi:glycogen operon protein